MTFKGKIGRTYQESKPYWPEPQRPPEGSPNIVLIILDDVGFAHFGCYGSDIETPNINRLAHDGLRFNNFHASALCSPTRASLLTGRNSHAVGMGSVPILGTGYPGYTGILPKQAAHITEILKEAGYSTFAVGKWHLTPEDEMAHGGPFDNWPLGRGFERFYGFNDGSTNQWFPTLIHDNHYIDPPASPEEGYHFSEDIVDKAIQFLQEKESTRPDSPYFLYLSFAAAHSPLHVPQEYIEKYRGRYDKGWDVFREETLARQKAMGIIPENTLLSPRNPGVKAWDEYSAEEQQVLAAGNERFAAFLDHADVQIGRFLEAIEEMGQMEDSLIILMSDNGASREGGELGSFNTSLWGAGMAESVEELLPVLDELGGPSSLNHYAIGWAMAGNTPLKRYKRHTYGGGIRVPFIVHWPRMISEGGAVRSQYHYCSDVLPTILELTGIEAPDSYQGVPQMPLHGTSMAYSFNDPTVPTRKEVQYFETLGNRGIWQQGWKAVTDHMPGSDFEDDIWSLYHLDEDFAENQDLAQQQPEKLREMVARWWEEAEKYQVLPLDDRHGDRLVDGKRSLAKQLQSFTYYPGLKRIPEHCAILTRNRDHTISAFVDIPEGGAEGALLVSGSSFGGYSLYVQDGKLIYLYNYFGKELYEICSTVEVPAARSVLQYRYENTGDHCGKGTLLINGAEVGSGLIGRTAKGDYHLGQGVSCGSDPMPAVSSAYVAPFTFTGKLHKVVVTVQGSAKPKGEVDWDKAVLEQ